MKPSISWLEYQKLEQIIPQTPDSRVQQNYWWSMLAQRWQNLFRPMTRPSDLNVWYLQDKAGTIWWSAHDSITGRSIDRVSEEQIRAWIEQRYR